MTAGYRGYRGPIDFLPWPPGDTYMTATSNSLNTPPRKREAAALGIALDALRALAVPCTEETHLEQVMRVYAQAALDKISTLLGKDDTP